MIYVLYYVSMVIVSFIFVHVYCSGVEEQHLQELKLLINQSIKLK